jgi:hypothetical protein
VTLVRSPVDGQPILCRDAGDDVLARRTSSAREDDLGMVSAELLCVARSVCWRRFRLPALSWMPARLAPRQCAGWVSLGPGWGRKDSETT